MLLPATVEKFKKIYAEKKDIVEWMLQHGNTLERAEAKIIKSVALEINA